MLLPSPSLHDVAGATGRQHSSPVCNLHKRGGLLCYSLHVPRKLCKRVHRAWARWFTLLAPRLHTCPLRTSYSHISPFYGLQAGTRVVGRTLPSICCCCCCCALEEGCKLAAAAAPDAAAAVLIKGSATLHLLLFTESATLQQRTTLCAHCAEQPPPPPDLLYSSWVLALHLQRSSTGTPARAESMCCPHPLQVGLAQLPHVVL